MRNSNMPSNSSLTNRCDYWKDVVFVLSVILCMITAETSVTTARSTQTVLAFHAPRVHPYPLVISSTSTARRVTITTLSNQIQFQRQYAAASCSVSLSLSLPSLSILKFAKNDNTEETNSLIWLQLMDPSNGNAYKNTRATKVSMPSTADIADFCKAVKVEYDYPEFLKDIPAATLLVYKNKAAYDAKDDPLDEEYSLSDSKLGQSKKDALIVVVPSLRITDFEGISDGVDPWGMYFDRQAVLDRMHKWITGVQARNRFLLLNSPAASGKTSLMLLFQQKYQNENLVIRYASLNIDFHPWTYLAQFGLNFYKSSCRYENVIYLLDDSQFVYDRTAFWVALIKSVPLIFPPGVRFIIAATHQISSGPVDSPPDLRLLETIGRDDLLLSPDQSMALLNSKPPLGLKAQFQNYSELKKTIVEHCNGLIGALCKSVLFYGDQRIYPLTQVDCIRLFFSKKFIVCVDRCFGVVDKSRITSEMNNILLKCVLGEPIHYNVDSSSLDVLMSFVKAGILVFDGSNFMFSSPLAKRYFSNCYFPNRAGRDPPNLRVLVMKAIKSMSAMALKLSTSSASGFPNEATFQQFFLMGLLWNTTPNTAICSQLSTSFSSGTQVKGRIDFFVNGNLMWGIELVRSGAKIGEHISRFSSTGKCYGLEATDYIVVDFRRMTKKIRRDPRRATVLFETDANGQTCFDKAKVTYGIHEPVVLKLQP